MGGITALLGVARDGLLAYSGSVSLTGQNISSAGMPGYVRRAPELTARAWIGGGGVQFEGAERVFDRFTHAKLVFESGNLGAATARLQALDRAEGVVAPGGGNPLGASVDAFFAATAAVSANAGDRSARAVLLSRSGELARAVSSTAAGLSTLRGELAAEAQSVATEITDRASRIARLNADIATAEAQGADASSLRDSRDELVRELGDKFGARAIEDERGRLTVFAGGTAIVEGDEACAARASLAPTGELRYEVVRPGGTVLDVTANAGGALAGLREARDVDVVAVQAGLDQLAYDFTSAVNALHASGFGLDGATGRPLFTPPAGVAGAAYAMAIDPSVGSDPAKIAACSTAAGLPGGNDLALRLQALASSALGAGGTASDRVGAWAASLGVAKQAAQHEADLRESTVQQARAMNESESGVSLDEEMIDLQRFQRAFEAQTKVLKTADELLEGLIKEL